MSQIKTENPNDNCTMYLPPEESLVFHVTVNTAVELRSERSCYTGPIPNRNTFARKISLY